MGNVDGCGEGGEHSGEVIGVKWTAQEAVSHRRSCLVGVVDCEWPQEGTTVPSSHRGLAGFGHHPMCGARWGLVREEHQRGVREAIPPTLRRSPVALCGGGLGVEGDGEVPLWSQSVAPQGDVAPLDEG